MDANANRSRVETDPNLQRSSHLFLVRVWTGEAGDDQGDWYGKVQHVLSGETHTFKDWNSLQPLVEGMLPARIDYSQERPVPMPRD